MQKIKKSINTVGIYANKTKTRQTYCVYFVLLETNGVYIILVLVVEVLVFIRTVAL